MMVSATSMQTRTGHAGPCMPGSLQSLNRVQLKAPSPGLSRKAARSRPQRGTCVAPQAARQEAPTRKAERAADAGKQQAEGLIDGLRAAQRRLEDQGVDFKKQLGLSLLAGLTFGTAFQVTHNQEFLPIYDVWPFMVGPFFEAWTIPLTLAPIWLLYGYLQPVVDEYTRDSDPEVATAQRRAEDWSQLVLVWTALAAHFVLSDVLYLQGAPHWVCTVTLAIAFAAVYKTLDNTKGGAVLAGLLTVGAPLGEVFIVNVLHLWHYDRPDFFGVPHWAGWCYACYAIGVGTFGRWLVNKQRDGAI